jgi:two-component system CheB/CheR fusion protein
MEQAGKKVQNMELIVGIGASAGGLEAIQQFLSHMTNDSNASFVIVQHLSPDYKSLMAEILSKSTQMTVEQAENDQLVKPNHVYLIPPKNNITLKNGRLYLNEYTHGTLNHPIDIFLTSLAEESKENCIAVVLSGTGTDGTAGIKAVKEAGGLVIVQDPLSAKFDGMPRSAINTGLADFILSPSNIAAEILDYTRYPGLHSLSNSIDMFSDDELLTRIYNILKCVSHIDYTHYKQSTVARRIERRMTVIHAKTLKDYVSCLENQPDEARILGREILIGVTSFFRDAEFFKLLKTEVITPIITRAGETEPIRIWSVGCSTGEEAYSLAILCREVAETYSIKPDIKIFASDVDTDAIERAGKGEFSESIIDDVSTERLSKFFIKKGDKYVVQKDIRKMIIFAPHNVFQDPPFGKLDLICCRNVMIYFQQVLQKSLFSIFHTALKDGGYLFLGKSETAGEYSKVFVPVYPGERIYRHKADVKAPDLLPVAYTVPRVMSAAPAVAHEEQARQSGAEDSAVYLSFLENFMMPSAVINGADELVHTFGHTDDYLHSPKGKMTKSIYDFLNTGLALIVSTAISRVKENRESVSYTGVQIKGADGAGKTVNLIVQPVTDRFGTMTDYIAIVFCDGGAVAMPEGTEPYDVNETAARRIVDLERELQDSQDNLHASIGELETVNEELQAANEELLTANEELQSSNEELQSVNEELYTVNAEYQEKLDELTDLNNDMSNFLSSTMIGIVFVDQKLNIRKFTDYIGREFDLIAQDVGRPLQMLSHFFTDSDLAQDAVEVIKTLAANEREVTSIDGKHYTMRISPYRTTDNVIKGAVITIIDGLLAQNQGGTAQPR